MLRAVAWSLAVAMVAGLCWADPAPVVEYKVIQRGVESELRDLDGGLQQGHTVFHIDVTTLSGALSDLSAEGWEVVDTDLMSHGSFYHAVFTLRRELPATSQYDLSQGWNMIGVGQIGQGQIPLASVSFSDGVETKTWDEAVTAGWIQATAYRYEPGTGYVDVCPACAENCFMPGTGYLLLTFVDDLTLLLP